MVYAVLYKVKERIYPVVNYVKLLSQDPYIPNIMYLTVQYTINQPYRSGKNLSILITMERFQHHLDVPERTEHLRSQAFVN